MQFKVKLHVNESLGGITVAGSTVQCIRLTQEKNDSGRRKAKVITTIDRWDNELSTKAKELLTAEEQEQWVKWKFEHDDKYRSEQLALALDAAPATINAAGAALREREKRVLKKGEKPPKPVESNLLWEAIDALTAALEDTGYERPKKPRGRPSKHIGDGDDGPANWLLGSTAPLPNFAPPGTNAHRQYQALLDTYESLKREQAKKGEP